ncbi:hypothetical protein JD844_005412 [Phrynosoma platyrhinos]|uniref:Connector enhancer of kinase suppressor of ras 2 n=1 Tax=Phrynosoma platyrhinos TaxID=52577 RepID=A0ABQ7TN28_PHRPL|nr:hypothetical protein JD844_005412 [Phrynosoma platyrhinos]
MDAMVMDWGIHATHQVLGPNPHAPHSSSTAERLGRAAFKCGSPLSSPPIPSLMTIPTTPLACLPQEQLSQEISTCCSADRTPSTCQKEAALAGMKNLFEKGGLDPALQDYPFETWGLNGKRLLHLSYRDLEDLGMSRVGHQELLLEAVEQLCVLNYELLTLNLRMLTEKLQGVIRTIQAFILSHRKVSTYNGDAVDKPTSDLLACLHDYSASRDIIWLCGDLAEIVQKDCTVSEREERILLIGRHIFGICEQILTHSPAKLLNQTAILETVELVPTGPEDSLGIEIKSSPSCLHFISGTAPEVGWTRMNLAKKLLEIPDRLPWSFVPDSEESTISATYMRKELALTYSPPGASADLAQEEQSFQSVSEGHTTPETASPTKPRTLELGLQSPPSPENGFVRGSRGLGATDPSKEASQGSIEYRRKQKGMATRLSRRRISCQELGQVDCDGWLLKKKDHVGFMAQKWKRFWFVLKGHTLYWYNNPNDEKAVGLINVSAYRLESTKEQKKK